MAEWQPISTAPKDGTPILLYTGDNDMIVGQWHNGWCLVEVGAWAEDDAVAGQPSHWMPLPEPPDA